MSVERKQYLVLMDFLFQKYEVEYEPDMSPERVIEKVQLYLPPYEIDKEMISTKNEEKHQKLQLYRSNFPDYYGLVPVTENITEEELDYNKYQFYLFQPTMNVYLTLYVIDQNNINNNTLKINLIFPVKKTISDLRRYLTETLLHYAIDTNNQYLEESMRKRFKLYIKSTMTEFDDDDDIIDQSLNDAELCMAVNIDDDKPKRLISLQRFYYKINLNENEIDSLDYDYDGLTLIEAKKKLIEKHFNDKIKDDHINIIFNGIVQTQKFNKLDDLFSDNHYYFFTVIYEPQDKNTHINYNHNDERSYSIPVPYKGRPLIVKIE